MGNPIIFKGKTFGEMPLSFVLWENFGPLALTFFVIDIAYNKFSRKVESFQTSKAPVV